MTTELQTNIAEEINKLHVLASHEADTSKTHADIAIEAAWMCGGKLNTQRGVIPHGLWLTWLAQLCPGLHIRTAQRYMGLADKYDTLSHLKEAQRTKALIAAGILPEPEPGNGGSGEPGAPKPDKGFTLIQSACQYFNNNDLTKLDDAGRLAWKGRLKPLVDLYERL